MRLSLIFISFFLGIISRLPSFGPGPVYFQFSILIISFAFICVPTRRFSIYRMYFICMAAFMAGNLWLARLPSWPTPARFPPQSEITGIVRAETGIFEIDGKRCLPVKAEQLQAVTPDEKDTDFSGYGFILLVPRNFVSNSGMSYEIRGKPVTGTELLHERVFFRYRSQGVIDTTAKGYYITEYSGNTGRGDAGNRLRYRLISHLSWGLTDNQGQLVAGITFGRKGRRLDGSWAGDFYNAGLSHLIVASGAQVSLLFMPVFFLLGGVMVSKPIRWLLLAALGALIIAFAELLGGEPSINRAAIMGCILLLSIGLGKHTSGIATLSAAGIIWLVINPLLAIDYGFLLSFAACFGIIYLSPMLFVYSGTTTRIPAPDVSLPRPRSWLTLIVYYVRILFRLAVNLTIVTISAQIGVLPVLAMTVGRLSIAGLFANVLAVPVAQMILFLGAFSGVSGFINPYISLKINMLLGHLADVLMVIAKDFARLPWANIPIDPVPLWVPVLWYGLIILAVERWRGKYQARLRRRWSGESTVIGNRATLIHADAELPSEML